MGLSTDVQPPWHQGWCASGSPRWSAADMGSAGGGGAGRRVWVMLEHTHMEPSPQLLAQLVKGPREGCAGQGSHWWARFSAVGKVLTGWQGSRRRVRFVGRGDSGRGPGGRQGWAGPDELAESPSGNGWRGGAPVGCGSCGRSLGGLWFVPEGSRWGAGGGVVVAREPVGLGQLGGQSSWRSMSTSKPMWVCSRL